MKWLMLMADAEAKQEEFPVSINTIYMFTFVKVIDYTGKWVFNFSPNTRQINSSNIYESSGITVILCAVSNFRPSCLSFLLLYLTKSLWTMRSLCLTYHHHNVHQRLITFTVNLSFAEDHAHVTYQDAGNCETNMTVPGHGFTIRVKYFFWVFLYENSWMIT